MGPTITKIESREFRYPLEDLGTDEHGFNLIYEPGETTWRKLFGIKIHTDTGITGEYVGGNSPGAAQINMFADYLVGKNPLKREKHWSEIKRALRKYDRMGIGPIDIALWDFAGKYYDAPIHELLGTYRTSIPAYASTYHGDENGGLDSPEAFADFGEECADRGFPGYKIHGWGGSDSSRDLERELEAIHAVGERVGDRVDLMYDPACEYETFATRSKLAARSTRNRSAGTKTPTATAASPSTATESSEKCSRRRFSRPNTCAGSRPTRISSRTAGRTSCAPIRSTTRGSRGR